MPTEDASAMEWRIRGYDSLTETLSLDVPSPQFSREDVCQLLWLLVARTLTEQEIVDAALGRNSLLEIRTDESPGQPLILMAGRKDPHYVAGLFPRDTVP